MASKGKPYRTVEISGFQVLIGKSASDNDYLSLKVARQGDTWLHTAGGVPGSHVVICNPDHLVIPQEVLKAAASLAAWYSKAKNAKRVDVHYCLAKHVSKRRGAPAGQVQLSQYRSVTVPPLSLEALGLAPEAPADPTGAEGQ